jgi:hypothetical protein
VWSKGSFRVWVRNLESQNASSTLVEQLAPFFWRAAQFKEISGEPQGDLGTWRLYIPNFYLPRTGSEALSYKNKYLLLGVRFFGKSLLRTLIKYSLWLTFVAERSF